MPLINGCEILVCSTPFSLLRMIGHGHTNLERLQYLVFDEANLLVEKFPRQIKTLLAHYHNLLKINEQQPVAQFILMTHYWSTKLNVLLDKYMMSRVVITTNKLEAAYFGRTQHAIYECEESSRTKFDQLVEILKRVSFESSGQPHHTVVFTNKSESAMEIGKLLVNIKNYAHVHVVHRGVASTLIKKIEYKWNTFESRPSSIGFQAHENNNLILIVEQDVIRHINIGNAKCVIHYDFPESKRALADRLWFMRKHFAKTKTILNPPLELAISASRINLLDVDEKNRCFLKF